jgi:hypothetical protein
MMLIVFGVGFFVFFLTVYGTVMAGGLMLTKEQLDTSDELEPQLSGGSSSDDISLVDVARAEF